MTSRLEESAARLSLLDHPRRWAGYLPAQPALAERDGPSVDYATLDRRVQRTAVFLQGELGLARGDRVAVLAHNSGFLFELAFACFRAGLVLAPLNYRLAIGELEALLALAAPRALFVDTAHRPLAALLRLRNGLRNELRLIDVADYLAAPPRELAPARPLVGTGDEEAALLLLTSGTTGLPKAAALPARQLFWNGLHTQIAFALTRADSTLVYTPLFHTGGLNVLAMPLFQQGGSVHVHERFDPVEVVRAIAARRVTTIFGVPTTLRTLADTPGFFEAAARHLRLCLCGGAPLSLRLVRDYARRGVPLTQGFGMTEVGPNCFFLPPHAVDTRAGSVGQPMPYGQTRLVVDGRDAAPGEVGELWLRGPHVFSGYFRNPAATDAAFADGWFRTGDLLKRDEDGYFSVAGRQKDMFISGGENVYPAEIEVALHGHPAVADCAVVAVPDPRWGEVGCAFVVTREQGTGAGAGAEDMRRFLRERLAHYKVPRIFVSVEALPRNESGKVLKGRLVEEARRHAA